MRLQLAIVLLALAGAEARGEDRTAVSTTLFVENRDSNGKGGLVVVHPQASFGIDLGRFVTFDIAYSADAVSGATATIYQVDAVSSATTFDDFRNEGTITFGFQGKRSRLTFTGTFGTERDYISRQVGGAASIDLPGRNTTVGLAYTHGFDQVCNRDNGNATPLESVALIGDDTCKKDGIFYGSDFVDPNTDQRLTLWEDLSIDTAQATITQNISPTMNAQFALFGQIAEGFQSNPYRRVRVGPNTPQEHLPDTRARWSVSARLNRYLPAIKAAAHFDARFYDDTWGVIGLNAELGYSQYMGKNLLLRLHTRFYQQEAATFFKDAFFYETESTAGEYFTGDRELARIRNINIGGKLSIISIGEDKPVWGLFDKLQLIARGEVVMLSTLAADADNPMGIDKQFINGGGLLDAIVLQLGLLGNY
jgi:hypothetical protein